MTSAVGRNPGAFTQVLVHGILAIALTEGHRVLRAVSRSLNWTDDKGPNSRLWMS